MKPETENLEIESPLLEFSRRRVLKWSAPVVVGISLPAHGQMSPFDGPSPSPPPPPPAPQECGSAPVLVATSPSKCAGSNPVIGEILMNLISDGATSDPIDILGITHTGTAEQTISIVLNTIPMQITTTQAIEIGWVGEASDNVNCLPVQDVTITVTYSCADSPSTTIDFSLAAVVANA